MIFRVFGGERAGIGYLLRNNTAQIMRGDASTTTRIITGLNFRQRFCSGCLSFTEQLSAEQCAEIIDEAEIQLAGGLDRERLDFLWVRHSDKDRTELHFVMPEVDLASGKKFSPYVHRRDAERLRTWQRLVNIRDGFSDPDEPRRRLNAKPNPRAPGASVQQQADGIIAPLLFATVHDRADVVRELRSAGMQIQAETAAGKPKKFITAIASDGKRTRLKGIIYESDFGLETVLEKASAWKSQRAEELQMQLDAMLARRAADTRKRFPAVSASPFPPVPFSASPAPMISPFPRRPKPKPRTRYEPDRSSHRNLDRILSTIFRGATRAATAALGSLQTSAAGKRRARNQIDELGNALLRIGAAALRRRITHAAVTQLLHLVQPEMLQPPQRRKSSRFPSI
jgi:hypothetical protein